MKLFLLKTLLISLIVMPSRSFADSPFFDIEGYKLAVDHISYPGGCVPGKVTPEVDVYYGDSDLRLLENREDITAAFAKKFMEDSNRNLNNYSSLNTYKIEDVEAIKQRSYTKTQLIINPTIFPSQEISRREGVIKPGAILNGQLSLLYLITEGIYVKRADQFKKLEFPYQNSGERLSPDCRGYYVMNRNPVDCYMEVYSFGPKGSSGRQRFENQTTKLVILHMSLHKLVDWSRDSTGTPSEPGLEVLGTSEQVARNMMWCFDHWYMIFTPLTGISEATP